MAFKLRSGNGTTFKNMGTSPFKDMKTGKYEHSFESPAKHPSHMDHHLLTEKGGPGLKGGPHPPTKTDKKKESPAKQKIEKIPSKKAERLATSKTGRVMQDVLGKSVSKESDTKSTEREQRSKHTSKRYSPLKQRSGTEGQDQNKIFNDKGEHVGNYVNGKKVMLSAHGQLNDAKKEAIRDMKMDGRKKTPSPAKQYLGKGEEEAYQKLKADLIKKNRDKKKVKNNKPAKTDKLSKTAKPSSPAKQVKIKGKEKQFVEPAKKAKGSYYYKIDGKPVTKQQYIKHKHEPGNMEGGGKQTNNPDVYGRKKGGSPSNPK